MDTFKFCKYLFSSHILGSLSRKHQRQSLMWESTSSLHASPKNPSLCLRKSHPCSVDHRTPKGESRALVAGVLPMILGPSGPGATNESRVLGLFYIHFGSCLQKNLLSFKTPKLSPQVYLRKEHSKG